MNSEFTSTAPLNCPKDGVHLSPHAAFLGWTTVRRQDGSKGSALSEVGFDQIVDATLPFLNPLLNVRFPSTWYTKLRSRLRASTT